MLSRPVAEDRDKRKTYKYFEHELTSNRYQVITSVKRHLNGKSLTGTERNSGNCFLRNTTLVRKIVVICRLSFLQHAYEPG